MEKEIKKKMVSRMQFRHSNIILDAANNTAALFELKVGGEPHECGQAAVGGSARALSNQLFTHGGGVWSNQLLLTAPLLT